jgi:DNA helicase-2/ATP-dependent DNA helicase PcrA
MNKPNEFMEFEEHMQPHLAQLNKQQCDAATASWEGVLAIMAGPGSGKTKTLISRLAHLIRVYGLHATSLVIITFTNKAAEEIKNRCEAVLGHEQSKGIVAGTFHSVCATWLRKHANKIGLNRNFGILDTDEGLSIIKRIMKDMKIEEIKSSMYDSVDQQS